jgi:succinoglycan biosynthesis protein ExoA
VTLRVSVIIPCFNEEQTIAQMLEALHGQTFPLSDMEVVIADGMSTDGTRQAIQTYAGDHPDLIIRLVDNPARIIPAALNRAIEQARGEVVIRLDAHALPYPDYIERSLQALEGTGAANAGGVWEIRPSAEGWQARSIAVAAGHRLGAGDARYRTLGKAGPADTVPFGAFRREWLERIGLFDESLISNEDYELNVRLRRAGGLIWLDPAIRSVYFARGDLAALSRQYARYGFWKTRMLVRNVDTIRWRQALPPAFVLASLALAALGVLWHPAWGLLGVQWAVYVLVCICVGGAEAVTKGDAGLILGFPLAIWTMHLSWGGGFLWGLATWLVGKRDERRGA